MRPALPRKRALAFSRSAGVAAPAKSVFALATMGSPVVVDDRAYLVDGASDVSRLDPSTGEVDWTQRLDPAGSSWTYIVTATPS